MTDKAEGWQIHITEMDLFSGLDLNVMGEIADVACTEEKHSKGTVLFNKGEAAEALYILEHGTVDLEIGGGKRVYRLTAPGEIFGWSGLVENAGYTATAIAGTDIQAVKIDTRQLNRVLTAHPLFGLTVYRRLCAVFNKRLSNIYHRFLSV